MSNAPTVCGLREGFVLPSSGFRYSKRILYTVACPYFDNFEFHVYDAGVLSANLSRLLPLQLEFERFKYISFS